MLRRIRKTFGGIVDTAQNAVDKLRDLPGMDNILRIGGMRYLPHGDSLRRIYELQKNPIWGGITTKALDTIKHAADGVIPGNLSPSAFEAHGAIDGRHDTPAPPAAIPPEIESGAETAATPNYVLLGLAAAGGLAAVFTIRRLRRSA